MGAGGVLKFDIADKENITDTRLGIYLEGSADVEVTGGALSAFASIGIEGVIQDDGKSSIELQNDASISVTGLGNETAVVQVDNGKHSSDVQQNTEAGMETMLFLGFGGSGFYDIGSK